MPRGRPGKLFLGGALAAIQRSKAFATSVQSDCKPSICHGPLRATVTHQQENMTWTRNTLLYKIHCTSWFKLNDGNSLPHECCLHYQLKCHIFSIILTAMNSSGRGWLRQLLCSGPTDRTGASGENVSPPTTGLQKGQSWSGISVEKQPFFLFFCSERADCRYFKAWLQNVSRRCWNIWLRRANIKSYSSPKVDPILKLRIKRQLRKLHTFLHKSPNAHAAF